MTNLGMTPNEVVCYGPLCCCIFYIFSLCYWRACILLFWDLELMLTGFTRIAWAFMHQRKRPGSVLRDELRD